MHITLDGCVASGSGRWDFFAPSPIPPVPLRVLQSHVCPGGFNRGSDAVACGTAGGRVRQKSQVPP